MNKIFPLLLFSVFATDLHAQMIIQKDPEIISMVQEVSTDSLRAYVATLVSFGTRNSLSAAKDPKRGIGAARNWILSRFREYELTSNGRLRAWLDTTTYLPDGKRVDTPLFLANVMAELKGTDPADKRIFIISGHLDSRRSNVMDHVGDAPGANDDGSGVSAVLECARIMSKHRFPATIIFVTVSGEEQGLLGATFLASRAKKENWDIEAMLNNDIMGGKGSNQTDLINNQQVRVFSEGLPHYELDKQAGHIRDRGEENDGKSRQLARYVKEIGERYVDNLQVVMIYRTDRYLRGGDHLPFIENGFTAVRITEMNENYNHQHQDVRNEQGVQYGDLPEFMDFEYLRKNTAMNLSNLANLAKSPALPELVTMDISKLSNLTRLSWKVPLSGKPKGYYLLMRETTSPTWQKKIFTTQTDIELPYSKDNYFFAVQSLSDAGNESLPVIPVPVNVK